MKILEGKVIKEFNDKENNFKNYTKGKKFRAEDKRYKELQAKGFVEEGKEVKEKLAKINVEKGENDG